MTTQQLELPPSGRRQAALRWLRRATLALVALVLVGFVTTRLLVARAESQFPPRGELHEVNGLQQHVVVRGEGPQLVLVHGAFGASQDFVDTVVDELSTRYRCVVWDRPGHGYSERPSGVVGPNEQASLLLELMRGMQLERPLLVGFSYGGAVALAAGMQDPEAMRGLVLLNGPSHEWPDPIDLHYRLPQVPVLGSLAVEAGLMPLGLVASERSVERAFSPLPVTESFARSPIALSLRPHSYRANAEDIRRLKPCLKELSAGYAGLDLPLTLVVSESDLVVSPTIHAPHLHAAAPRSELIHIPGAGHQILYTHPHEVIAAIDGAMGRP